MTVYVGGVVWGLSGVLTVIKLYLWTHRTITTVTVCVGGVGWGLSGVLTVINLIFVDASNDNPQ